MHRQRSELFLVRVDLRDDEARNDAADTEHDNGDRQQRPVVLWKKATQHLADMDVGHRGRGGRQGERVRPLSTFKLSRHRVMSWTSREEVCKPARSETEAGPEETTGRVATARDTAGAEEPPSLRWRV